MDRVHAVRVNSAENIQLRCDDHPGHVRQLVIDDVTFAQSVLMYEAFDLMQSAYARGLGFAVGVVDESKATITVNGREYALRTEIGTALVRDEVGCPVVSAVKLSSLDLAPENLGHNIEATLDGAGVFKCINDLLVRQCSSIRCRIDRQAQIVGVSRDVWARLQQRFPCANESVHVTSAEMVMRANPQLTKLHVVDFDREATGFESSINCIAYRTAVSDATA